MDLRMKIFKIICIFLTRLTVLKADGDEIRITGCHYDIDILESHHVSSGPVVSHPLVADINIDGTLDIAATTFDGTIDVVDGITMKQHTGAQWPHHFQNSSIYSSPLLFDCDRDGIKEILVCTSDGDITFFKPDGTILPERTIRMSPLLVARQWLNDGMPEETDISQIATTSKQGMSQTRDFIAVDAHILASPALADLNVDGREEELALPVSYYDVLDSQSDNNQDVVGSALVIVNLTTGTTIKEIPLHITKKSAPAPAYLLHPPTLVDLDSQGGQLEIVAATASGQLHVLDIEGRERNGFPLKLNSAISGQVSIEDLDDDGSLELITIQSSGEVTHFNNHGNRKWSAVVSGDSFPGSRLTDLDRNGILDIIIPSSDGNVWALSGETGNPLPHWPVYVGSRLASEAVITSLSDSSPSPEVIVTGYDGNLYIISQSPSHPPCIESIGIEEGMLVPVQVMDIVPHWPGAEIVAATIHGSLMLLSTQPDGEETKGEGKWMDATNDHKFAHRQNKHGIFAAPSTRQMSYVSGSNFAIEFDIEDSKRPHLKKTFKVAVFAGSLCLHPPVNFSEPGRKQLVVAAPSHPVRALVEIRMTNQYGQVFVDSFPVSFNTKITDEIQWLLVIPTVVMVILLLILYGYPEADLLPTSLTSKDR